MLVGLLAWRGCWRTKHIRHTLYKIKLSFTVYREGLDLRRIQDKFKFVSSFQGIEEYKKVLAGVSKEREIKVRIKELLRYRKNGINNIQESESYEAERIKRNTGKADMKKALEVGLPEPVRIKDSND